MSGLYLRDEYGNKIPLPAIKGEKGDQGEQGVVGDKGDKGDKGDRGDGLFIRYSSFADGSEFTEKWTDGQDYIGIAHGDAAPVDKGGYEWSKFGSSELVDEVSNNAKRITNLEQGLMQDRSVTDATTAYSKTIPSTALPYFEVAKLGGMSYQPYNRIPFPYADGVKTVGGLTFTPNDDGSISITGVATHDAAYVLCYDIHSLLTPKMSYRVSLIKEILDDVNYSVAVNMAIGESEDQIRISGGSIYSIYADGRNESVLGIHVDADPRLGTFNRKVYPIAISQLLAPVTASGNSGKSGKFFPYDPEQKILHSPVTKITVGDYSLEIPTEVQNLEGYGVGISDTVNNYLEWVHSNEAGKEQVLFHRVCTVREYQDGDGDRSDVVTNFIDATVAPLDAPEVVDVTKYFGADNFIQLPETDEAKHTVVMNNEHEHPVPSEIIYQV